MMSFTTRQAKAKAMQDLIELQKAPISQDESADTRLHDILVEAADLGLPESDAVWFYRKMQRDGWKFGGVPLTNWRWTLSNFAAHRFFPSQRAAG